MARSSQRAPKALDQARRRTIKPADERRRDILAAAAQLFRASGFEGTGVQEIARSAGVAAGTVYLYFPSKEAILVGLQEDFEAGLVDRFSEISEAVLAEEDATGEIVGYREVIDRLIDGVVAFSLENRTVAEVLARHAALSPLASGSPLGGGLTEVLARVIRAGVRLGYIHTSDPETAAYLLNAASATAIGRAIAFENQQSLDRVVRATKELYVKALAPDQ